MPNTKIFTLHLNKKKMILHTSHFTKRIDDINQLLWKEEQENEVGDGEDARLIILLPELGRGCHVEKIAKNLSKCRKTFLKS